MQLNLKQLDPGKCKSIINYAELKGLNRKTVYFLMSSGAVDFVEIDGSKFIYMTDKSINYKRRNQ